MKLVYSALIMAAVAASPAMAPAQTTTGVTVIVNGQTMSFDQPPVEQAGRVFVPLRGIFEQLGASVVYQGGTINATGDGRNISLHIGSNEATVNGRNATLDSPPFVQGSRTLVPLRFVAQALGASVDWNNNTSTVTITGGSGERAGYSHGGGNPDMRQQQQQQQPPMSADAYVIDREPQDVAPGPMTAVSARFADPMRRDSLRITVDGRDVTSAVNFNDRGFQWTPGRPLDPGPHHVHVTGMTRDGASVDTGWTFRVRP